jgi:hypothetical protein
MSRRPALPHFYEWAFLTFCILSVTSVGYMFADAALQVGPAASVHQITQASREYPWVMAVFWDISMFNIFICTWLFYRESSFVRAVATSIAWWGTGSIFLGTYIIFLWMRSRSFEQVLLGKHTPVDR